MIQSFSEHAVESEQPLNPYEAPRLSEPLREADRRAMDEDLSTSDWILAFLCSGIGCILGIVTSNWTLAILGPGIGCIMGIVWMIRGKPKGSKMLGASITAAIIWNILGFALLALSE